MDYSNSPTQGNVLTWGILGLAFSGVFILGLIFSIVGKNKAKAYVAAHGQLEGAAKAGGILSTLGLIFSIIATVAWIIWVIAIIGATR